MSSTQTANNMTDSQTIRAYPQILCIGDSITRRATCHEGYVARLADEYSGKYDVVSRGFGGYNSRQLLRKFGDDLYAGTVGSISVVKLITLHIGTNDSVLFGPQQISLSEYKDNLGSIVRLLRTSHPSAHILLISPSTCDPVAWANITAPGPVDRSPESALEYARASMEIARSEGIPSVDAWKIIDGGLSSGRDGAADVFTDGVHFTSRGYKYLADEIIRTIKSEFKDIDPNSLPYSFALWEDYPA